jgi:polyhydroxyalkanoate synthesis repressor PhaR
VSRDSQPPRARVIRRYGNRKLYDPEARSYATLDDVAGIVAGGGEVEVVDQKTGEDLTSFTLAQALLERVRRGASRLPRQVLARLIRIAGTAPSAWSEWPEPQDAARRARQEAERIVSRLLGAGGLTLDDAVGLRRDLGQMVQRLVTEAQAGVESRLRPLLERGEGVAGRSLEAIRGGIQAFEARIDESAAGPAATPGSRGRAPRSRRRSPRGRSSRSKAPSPKRQRTAAKAR